MARNLSERLLDMVEDDPRFIGMHPATIIAWLKIIRLLDRNAKLRDGAPENATTWREVRFRLGLSDDRLLTLMDIFAGFGLLRYVPQGGFMFPPEVLPFLVGSREKRPAKRRQLPVTGIGDS